jgi:hypothetical protein
MKLKRCRNGHDLTIEGAILDGRYCAKCREATERAADRRRVQRRRAKRLTVDTTERIVERHTSLAEMHRAVALETAPAWVLRSSREEQDRWLAAMREERLRQR